MALTMLVVHGLPGQSPFNYILEHDCCDMSPLSICKASLAADKCRDTHTLCINKIGLSLSSTHGAIM